MLWLYAETRLSSTFLCLFGIFYLKKTIISYMYDISLFNKMNPNS